MAAEGTERDRETGCMTLQSQNLQLLGNRVRRGDSGGDVIEQALHRRGGVQDRLLENLNLRGRISSEGAVNTMVHLKVVLESNN